MFARVFANLAIRSTNRAYDEKVSVLHELDSLTQQDLRVLKLFQGKTEATVSQLNWQSLGLTGNVNQQLEQLASNLAKLESRGLLLTVFTHTGVVYVPSGFEQWAARWQETRYRVLPLGQALVEALAE